MWLGQFLKLFPEASKRVTGRILEPAKLEDELRCLHDKAAIRIGGQELRKIEESPDWTYPRWWPKYSSGIKAPVEVPSDLRLDHMKLKAIAALYDPLQHIEVVSVVLRFVFPEHFGIISPPVISLLSLVPVRAEQHPEFYLRYLKILQELSALYRNEDQSLRNLANVDMGLWAAAHLSTDARYEAPYRQMQDDDNLQEIRLRNMAEGLADYWTGTLPQRLLFAKVVLKHDHRLSGLIASKCFEEAIYRIAERSSLRIDGTLNGDETLIDLIRQIAKRKDVLAGLHVTGQKLHEWRKLRNDLVHAKPKNPVAAKDVKEFIQGIRSLYERFDNLPGSA